MCETCMQSEPYTPTCAAFECCGEAETDEASAAHEGAIVCKSCAEDLRENEEVTNDMLHAKHEETR